MLMFKLHYNCTPICRLPVTDGMGFGLLRQRKLCVDSVNKEPTAKPVLKPCNSQSQTQVSKLFNLHQTICVNILASLFVL